MALSPSIKTKVRAAIHRAYCSNEVGIPWTKTDLDTAITDLDGWLDLNASALNLVLSQPFRSLASTPDKAVLLVVVSVARYLADNPELLSVLSGVVQEARSIAEE